MRILLAVHSAYTDPTSGAARSVRTIVEWLAAAGHDCRVLATARFDGLPTDSIDEHLAELDVTIEPARSMPKEAPGLPAIQFELNGVPVTMLLTRHNRLDQPDRAESKQFLATFDQILRQFEPDLLLTYGGHPVVQEVMRRARRRGITTLFTVRRTGYEDPFWFRHADHVLAAGPFLRDHYRRAIGLASTGIEPPIDWSECTKGSGVFSGSRRNDVLDESEPLDRRLPEKTPDPLAREYVTFVNPSLQKGAAFFARLADVLGSRRPDIPILVVESAMDGRVLGQFTEVNLARYPQIMTGPSTRCPADFFALTKILLVPSVCDEAFPRVAVESLINGIPPLVSDRGGLPQAVCDAGRILPIPAWMTPASHQLPSVEEVEPWYRAICELWDDPDRYAAASTLARRTAQEFYAEPLMRRRYLEYFESLQTKHSSLETATKENADESRLQVAS